MEIKRKCTCGASCRYHRTGEFSFFVQFARWQAVVGRENLQDWFEEMERAAQMDEHVDRGETHEYRGRVYRF